MLVPSKYYVGWERCFLTSCDKKAMKPSPCSLGKTCSSEQILTRAASALLSLSEYYHYQPLGKNLSPYTGLREA